jgi:hypothetical protein
MERGLTAFIATADESGYPPVHQLADATLEVMRSAWDRVVMIRVDQSRDRVLATNLLLSQRARSNMTVADPEQWQLHAASTLTSGLVVAASSEGT